MLLMIKKTLLILTFNEINGSKALYDKIPFNLFNEIFVIDGNSSDGTIDFWKDKGHNVIIQKIPGRGAAFVEGVEITTGDHILFFSPDGNEDPGDIPKLLDTLEGDCDLVIASRFMKGSKSDDATWFRRFGNNMFTFLVNLFFRAKVRDAVNGFRAIKREKFEKLNLPPSKFEIEFQMTARAGKLKYTIIEIPTHEKDRIGGYSKAGSFSVGFSYIKVLLREIFIGKKFLKGDKKDE